MEEYTQMTLNDWMVMKESLKKDLIGVQESFVRIGYKLRQIEEKKLYENDGYQNIAEFAKEEYGLSSSTVSRFIAINRKYSINGYSEELCPEYEQLGSSKLSEMLALPDSDLQIIRPEATRENIRELKQFNKQEPAAGEADELHELIEMFFKEHKDVLNDLYASRAYEQKDYGAMADIINPSGNRSYRKGMYFLMMYVDDVKIKRFGTAPDSMSWQQFITITEEIFGADAEGAQTWQNHFGADQEEKEPEKEKTEQLEQEEEPVPQPEKETPEQAVAPAQFSSQRLEKNDIPESEKTKVIHHDKTPSEEDKKEPITEREEVMNPPEESQQGNPIRQRIEAELESLTDMWKSESKDYVSMIRAADNIIHGLKELQGGQE